MCFRFTKPSMASCHPCEVLGHGLLLTTKALLGSPSIPHSVSNPGRAARSPAVSGQPSPRPHRVTWTVRLFKLTLSCLLSSWTWVGGQEVCSRFDICSGCLHEVSKTLVLSQEMLRPDGSNVVAGFTPQGPSIMTDSFPHSIHRTAVFFNHQTCSKPCQGAWRADRGSRQTTGIIGRPGLPIDGGYRQSGATLDCLPSWSPVEAKTRKCFLHNVESGGLG